MKIKFVFKKYVLRYNIEKIYSSTDILNLKVRCLRFLYEVDNRTLHFILCWTECFEESVYQRKGHKFRVKKCSCTVSYKERIQFMFLTDLCICYYGSTLWMTQDLLFLSIVKNSSLSTYIYGTYVQDVNFKSAIQISLTFFF